jgi:hypothetical protein
VLKDQIKNVMMGENEECKYKKKRNIFLLFYILLAGGICGYFTAR